MLVSINSLFLFLEMHVDLWHYLYKISLGSVILIKKNHSTYNWNLEMLSSILNLKI